MATGGSQELMMKKGVRMKRMMRIRCNNKGRSAVNSNIYIRKTTPNPGSKQKCSGSFDKGVLVSWWET